MTRPTEKKKTLSAPAEKATTTKPLTTTKAAPAKPPGTVAFVGAGPGDPGLLTVRAVELLAAADVVVAENQDEAFLARFCKPGVEVVDGSVGDDGQALSHAMRAKLV
ncbi:MAG: uroporphyrinogen methyltransferase / synthase, partial [Actinomycetota bacterium]|nr:uroporphyrinogen methyltransferase / synthase [Actinomycetota bacterium]